MASSNAGETLRRIRLRLRLTTREVDQASRRIAAAEANQEYVISHARLTQVESGESAPSVYKLYSLSAIYGLPIEQMLALYVNLPQATHYRREMAAPSTHLISSVAEAAPATLEFPIALHAAFDGTRTNLVSQMVDVWGEVPVALLQGLSLRKSQWGYVGLNDYTMHPLLRPGSLVQIDPDWKASVQRPARSEFDRPIYFIELRDGYVCSWCEFRPNHLVCVPHPLSPVPTRQFAHPQQAEIIGRVIAVAARLVDRTPGTTAAANPQAAAASLVASERQRVGQITNQ